MCTYTHTHTPFTLISVSSYLFRCRYRCARTHTHTEMHYTHISLARGLPIDSTAGLKRISLLLGSVAEAKVSSRKHNPDGQSPPLTHEPESVCLQGSPRVARTTTQGPFELRPILPRNLILLSNCLRLSRAAIGIIGAWQSAAMESHQAELIEDLLWQPSRTEDDWSDSRNISKNSTKHMNELT